MASHSGLRSTSSSELTEQEKKKLEEFDYVRFTICDINGVGRCKAIPRRHVASVLARGGVDIYAGVMALGPRSQIILMDEVGQINNGNAVMVPISDTIRSLPWATDGKFKVCEVLCETFWIKPYRDGAPQAVCPRAIARKQLEKLDGLGYQIFSGYEPEFTAFHKGTKEPIFKGNDIFSCRDFTEFESFIYFMDSGLIAAGADCGSLNTEYAPGQFEFPTAPKFGIESADMLFRLKNIIKEMGLKKDVEVTFMTQPVLKSFNNGLHFSHSLWDKTGKTNIFHHVPTNDQGNKAESYMSDKLTRWLGGLIKHTPALIALTCPTVNCYRRLGTPWAPGQADWGINNRYSSFRVKAGANDLMETYIENRIPSGAANPYIVLAATIAAGLAGLNDPPAELPPQGTGEPLPKSLAEALDALEKDTVMVEALGEEFVRWFCKCKREIEIKNIPEDDFEKEVEMYFKLI